MGGGGPITHDDPVTNNVNELDDDGEDWLYDNKFATERKGIFHYCIICHHIAGTTSRGHGEAPGDTFTMAGARISGTNGWCHVFTHELGHNLLGELDPSHQSECSIYHCDDSHCTMYESPDADLSPDGDGKGHRSKDKYWNYCSDCWTEMINEGVGQGLP
jgi:hypothetical protein